jgi:single-strand DNA-binding protein
MPGLTLITASYPQVAEGSGGGYRTSVTVGFTSTVTDRRGQTGGPFVNEAVVTVIGFVAQDPIFEVLASGTSLMSLRIGSTPRRYDREIGQWRDEDPMFLTVSCWRTLADNLQACELQRGDPVIVTGKLRIREYVKDGQRRFSAQVEATTVGHDLSRGIARFQRSQRTAGLPEDRRLADDVADRWLEEGMEENTEEITANTDGGAEDIVETDETAETGPFSAAA